MYSSYELNSKERHKLNSVLHLAMFAFKAIYLHLGCLEEEGPPCRISYLTVEPPQAPCLSVRRLIIFWIN